MNKLEEKLVLLKLELKSLQIAGLVVIPFVAILLGMTAFSIIPLFPVWLTISLMLGMYFFIVPMWIIRKKMDKIRKNHKK
jgi:hypothetical protein